MSINLADEINKIVEAFRDNNYSMINYEKEIANLRDEQRLEHLKAIEKRNELIKDYTDKARISDAEDRRLYYLLIKHVDKVMIGF